MSRKMKALAVVLALNFYSTQSVAADTESPAKKTVGPDLKHELANDEEYRSGKHYLLAGILTTAIGAGIGAGIILIGSMGDCSSSDKQKCNRESARSTNLALGIGLGGAAIGIPLMYYGSSKKRQAKSRLYSFECDQTISFTMLDSSAPGLRLAIDF